MFRSVLADCLSLLHGSLSSPHGSQLPSCRRLLPGKGCRRIAIGINGAFQAPLCNVFTFLRTVLSLCLEPRDKRIINDYGPDGVP